MDQFEKQFEDMDVRSGYMENAMSNSSASATPAEEVDNLIKMVADSNNLTLAAEMDVDGPVPQGIPQNTNAEEEKVRALQPLERSDSKSIKPPSYISNNLSLVASLLVAGGQPCQQTRRVEEVNVRATLRCNNNSNKLLYKQHRFPFFPSSIRLNQGQRPLELVPKALDHGLAFVHDLSVHLLVVVYPQHITNCVTEPTFNHKRSLLHPLFRTALQAPPDQHAGCGHGVLVVPARTKGLDDDFLGALVTHDRGTP